MFSVRGNLFFFIAIPGLKMDKYNNMLTKSLGVLI